MKVSDYVVQILIENGIQDLFLVSGGAIMHLLDSVGNNQDIRYYCNYHEQACAVAAEAYARVTGGVGACLVTTGPGAANALAGAIGSWYDSVPLLVISGQMRRDLLADYTKLRQTAPQEANILEIVRPITKYACRVTEPEMAGRQLQQAIDTATQGRPGPVWIELPLDVQTAEIQGQPGSPRPSRECASFPHLSEHVTRVLEEIRRSKRPILIAGNGIHAARSESRLRQFLDRTGLPIVLPHVGKDLVEEDHPCYLGIFGPTGQRRANFALQNSDCIVSLGTGLNIHKIGFNVAGFAPRARKVIVDIDPGQLQWQVVRPDLAVEADVGQFLEECLRQLPGLPVAPSAKWTRACSAWKEQYPVIVDEYYQDTRHVNSYAFMDVLSDMAAATDVFIAGNGLDTVSYYQAFRIQRGQRAMTSGWGSMGWDLPLAIGACIASGRARTICVTGDGSIQWNIQELLTIRHYNLPIKIFVFNNRGYSSIRATQNNFFDGRYVGADATSGVSNPNFAALAAAYGLRYQCISANSELQNGIAATLQTERPVLCEVNISPEQGVSPKASAFRREDGTLESRPLEDMAPFLPREEVWRNMHLFDDEDRSN